MVSLTQYCDTNVSTSIIITSRDAGRSRTRRQRGNQQIDHTGHDSHEVKAAKCDSDQRAGLIQRQYRERGGSYDGAKVQNTANPDAQRKDLQEANQRGHHNALRYRSRDG
jgi:hypothetical protein